MDVENVSLVEQDLNTKTKNFDLSLLEFAAISCMMECDQSW